MDRAIQIAARDRIFRFQRAPGATDDTTKGWSLGICWLDESVSPPVLYTCTGSEVNAATWQAPEAAAVSQVKTVGLDVNFNSPATRTLLATPDYARLVSVEVNVGRVFVADASISVGVAGTLTKYLAPADIDLGVLGVYEKMISVELGAAPPALVLTFAPGTGGVDGYARVVVTYVNGLA